MNTVTIYVNRDQNVSGYKVRLTDQGTHKVTLTEKRFKPYQGGDAAHQDDEVATVGEFPAAPSFVGEFEISTAGGGRATAEFYVDGDPWSPPLSADYTARKARGVVAKGKGGKEGSS